MRIKSNVNNIADDCAADIFRHSFTVARNVNSRPERNEGRIYSNNAMPDRSPAGRIWAVARVIRAVCGSGNMDAFSFTYSLLKKFRVLRRLFLWP